MNDQVCIGVCITDPETGACMGCGRMPDDVVEVATLNTLRNTSKSTTCKKNDAAPPLPPQVAAEAQNPSD